MGAKKASTGKRRTRKRAEAKSKGLAPAECAAVTGDDLDALIAQVEANGGVKLGGFRDPLGGHPTLVAALPIDRVSATPFQRDLSEAHAKRLSDAIGKLGHYLDPIVAVVAGEGFWTPNGRHRLEAMTCLGAKAITALVLPDPDIQFKILALNVEKAHALREKSLEVIRMYRVLAERDKTPEAEHALEFEEPAFATLGLCYEHNGRFAGGAYQSILKRVDGWLEDPLPKALKERESRAAKLEKLDAAVGEAVKSLKARGFTSPYLRSFVVARVNPLRFMKELPPFDDALDMILKRATKFNAEKVKQKDIAASAAPMGEEEA
jgi:ParB family chromosome partitioning protein